MENLPNIQLANGDTPEPDASAEARELETSRAAMSEGAAPDGLCMAFEFLIELATDTGADVMGDRFANSGPKHFRATLAGLDACRVALTSIEATAYRVAREDAQWHADALSDWRGVDVSLAPTLSE
jgi:hypothetical protein